LIPHQILGVDYYLLCKIGVDVHFCRISRVSNELANRDLVATEDIMHPISLHKSKRSYRIE
jgi:hypothetical protein